MLHTRVHVMGGHAGHHYLTPDELDSLHTRLLEMQEAVHRTIGTARAELATSERGGDEADQAGTEGWHGSTLQLLARQGRRLDQIQAALRRFEEGSYGYCEASGEPIGLQRLLAHPLATLSVEAQERRERRLGTRHRR